MAHEEVIVKNEGTGGCKVDTIDFVGSGVEVVCENKTATVTITGASSPFLVGMVMAWHGQVSLIPAGWALCDGLLHNGFTTPDLRDKFIQGAAGDLDRSTTGGSETHLHASAGGHTHDSHALTNASKVTGISVADHASHTHGYTQTVNHAHVQNINSGSTGSNMGYGIDTSTSGSQATAISTANPTGGVASGTTGNESASLSHAITDGGHTHTNTFSPGTHSNQGAHQHDTINHEPPWYKLLYICFVGS